MSLSLPNMTEGWPGCYSLTIPETGVRIPRSGTTSIDNVISQAVAYYRANGYVVPSGLRQRIIDECCAKQPPGTCLEDLRMPQAAATVTLGTALEVVWTGTRTLATWLTKGKVSNDQADKRASVCRACPHNQEVEAKGCRSCGFASRLNQLTNFVAQVIQKDRQPWDEGLKSCAVCHCSLSLKCRTTLDSITRYMPAAQRAVLPPHCWINTETKDPTP